MIMRPAWETAPCIYHCWGGRCLEYTQMGPVLTICPYCRPKELHVASADGPSRMTANWSGERKPKVRAVAVE